MARHPFHEVAIVGVHNTPQARVLEDVDTRTITMQAALGALDDAGLRPDDVDGIVMSESDFQVAIVGAGPSPSSVRA